MGEISGAVGGQLGFLAAQQMVGVGREAEQEAGRGNDRRAGADGRGKRARELAMSSAAGLAVVGLDQDV